MSELLVDLIDDLKKTNGGHILYHYDQIDCYLRNAVAYIVAGVENGGHVMFVENDRNLPHIMKELEKHLSKDEWARVHFANNFDFYYSNGNFNPETVINYFIKNAQPYLESGAALYTWGLVEWGNVKEYIPKIEEYEKKLDKMIPEKGIISLCAYDNKSTPDELKERLKRCHGVLVTDREYTYLQN
ncbi:DcmR-like sensory protein [Cytobacillus oceanisediminis]|uniref:DcmR-like sensory protein n=1 Tax=Cytobacillus oceanisediminis TaxID=665099 RepID=A0A2V3A3T9_9BACI|nr:MEDS domain-containing protein [Cytobacillus oceanisediminis]PWW28204.1 DcmR-like sensory protein [Cytobacillus oceanisediminis]